MKRLTRTTKAGIVAAGVALVSQAAQAQFTANNLYLGLTQSSASSDYLINLGPASGITGSTSTVNLSGTFSLSLFNSIFTGGANGVNMGVFGGQNQFPSSYDLFMTAPTGTSLSSVSLSSTTIGFAEGSLTRITTFPASGSGFADSSKLWTANVPTLAANDFFGASGVNPNVPIGNTGILNEGLWEATPSSTTYLGSFKLDTTGASPSLTYTPAVVPEPNVASILGIGGILFWMLRWRTNRSNV
jgi:hypothetical protein